jgi:type 1 glutamine amidotransferase
MRLTRPRTWKGGNIVGRRIAVCLAVVSALGLLPGLRAQEKGEKLWVVYDGGDGPGKGKRVVLVSGDQEYRSEETLPQLGKILAKRHGFKCTVLFAIDKDGTINPNVPDNIPGLEALDNADLMVIFTRFRNLSDEQMKHIVDYVEAGKPVIGIRTATHAFDIPKGRKYTKYTHSNREWEDGFGRQILGERWVSHHGSHGGESTRGIIPPGAKDHPIVRGIKDGDIWGPTDVYGVRLPLPGDSKVLVLGQVLKGMKPTDEPVAGKKNDPMMPIAWVKSYEVVPGKKGRSFTSTIGASQDFQSEGVRRLLVNACYWGVGLEDRIPARSDVDLVGTFNAHPFGFNRYIKGIRPSDLTMR